MTNSLIGQMIKNGFRNSNEEYIPRSVINDVIKILYNKSFRISNEEYRRSLINYFMKNRYKNKMNYNL